MAQITENQRIRRIKELLAELNKVPPDKQPEGERLPTVGGEPLVCQVITIGVDEVSLNPDSHRVRAQLQDDPEWSELSKDPYSEPAQRAVERHVRDARSQSDFAALKESLLSEGQDDPGVITHKGVLVNANTRAVAIREFEDPSRRYLRVAVLPETIQPRELALLELRLQMRKELKVEYTLTNELLFIEELSTRDMTDGQIARELRIYPESEKKGANEVQLRLRMLDLVREMQKIPAEPLLLTFFDELAYEQLRELDRNYRGLIEDDPTEARRVMESFLLSVAVGVTPVHQIRKIDPSFMGQYMLPQLEEDEGIGEAAGKLATSGASSQTMPPGADSLAGADGATPDDEDAVDVKGLIDAVTQPDKRVEVPSTNFVLERDDVKDAVKAAIITGIKEKRRDASDKDKLEAPIAAVRTATQQVANASESLKAVADDPQFDEKRRKSLEAAFKKLRRRHRDLEAALTKADIVAR